MKDIQKELETHFVADKTKMNLLAKIVTDEFNNVYARIQKIETALSLMQEALLRMENEIGKPKRKRSTKKGKGDIVGIGD